MNRLSSLALLGSLLTLLSTPALAHDKITTVIGGGPNGLPGRAANIFGAGQMALDVQGNLYVIASRPPNVLSLDQSNVGNVFKISPSGTVSVLAGDDATYYDGAAGPLLKVELSNPLGIAVDAAIPANVYIADSGNCLIRKLDQKAGLISTIAGTINTYQGRSGPNCGSPGVDCEAGLSGDGGLATAASIDGPTGIDQDVYGNFYVVDQCSNRIRRISAFSGYGLDQSTLQFSNAQPIGTSSPAQSITVSAVGPTHIAGVTLSAGFKEADNCAGTTLSAGQTCQILVSFEPTRAAYVGGSLRIDSDAFFGHRQFATPAGNPDTVALYGTGIK